MNNNMHNYSQVQLTDGYTQHIIDTLIKNGWSLPFTDHFDYSVENRKALATDYNMLTAQ